MKNLNKNISFEDITGDIPYNMTNDYMFRAVLQKNQFVLKGLVGSLCNIYRQVTAFCGRIKKYRTGNTRGSPVWNRQMGGSVQIKIMGGAEIYGCY